MPKEMSIIEMTVKISLIPNDFSHDLEKVFQLCKDENVKYVELASMWHKSILDLSVEEEDRVLALMKQYGIKAASIQTQIGKVIPPGMPGAKKDKNMHHDYEYNISKIERAIELAVKFNAKYIICYSFMNKKAHNPEELEKNWQLMFKTYEDFLPKLKAANKTMCIECDGGQFIGTVDEHLRMYEHFDSPHISANFDMANMYEVQTFERKDFERMHKWVPYFHCKDRKINKSILRFILGGSMPAIFGTGSIPWKRTISWFNEKKFDGFYSIEPHLHKNHFEGGRKCVKNLQNILKELNIDYE